MSGRKNTPFTNEHFAAFCLKMVGQPYWYGTCLYKCSESVLKSKTAQYPSHYTDSRTSRYKQDIQNKHVSADCIGGAKGYAWTGGGIGVLESIGTNKTFTSKYGSNGCPDKGANSMFSYAKSKGMANGVITTLPEIVGLALHMEGHVGFYVGNGYAVEWRGFSYGCVKTKVSERNWKYWYQLPFIQYTEESTPITPPEETPTPKPPIEEEPTPEQIMVEIFSSGGNVNIRTGNGTQYSRITSVVPGTLLPFIATAVNGWHAVLINGKVGWVSGNYSKTNKT